MPNIVRLSILITAILFCFSSCQKNKVPIELEQNITKALIPFYELGDTLTSDINTTAEQTTVVIDSNALYNFKISSIHNKNQFVSTYFIKISFNLDDNIKVLDSLASGGFVFAGPLISTFEYGDSIRYNLEENEALGWFPEEEIHIENSGWIKYQIFESNNLEVYNWKEGENYLGIKFGKNGEEKLGWMNIVYQDSLCYVKEGYYCPMPNQAIAIGMN